MPRLFGAGRAVKGDERSVDLGALRFALAMIDIADGPACPKGEEMRREQDEENENLKIHNDYSELA